MMRPLKPRILVAVFVLLAGISQAFAAQDKSAAEKAEKKGAQSTDASKKAAPDSPDPDEIRLGKPAVHEFVIANFKTEGGVYAAAGESSLRDVWAFECRARQCGAAALALYGGPSRL